MFINRTEKNHTRIPVGRKKRSAVKDQNLSEVETEGIALEDTVELSGSIQQKNDGEQNPPRKHRKHVPEDVILPSQRNLDITA